MMEELESGLVREEQKSKEGGPGGWGSFIHTRGSKEEGFLPLPVFLLFLSVLRKSVHMRRESFRNYPPPNQTARTRFTLRV